MQTVKISLEYGAFPVWLYDEDGNLLDNALPNYLAGDSALNALFDEIQSDYESLFTDDSVEFKYNGFASTERENEFNKKLALAKSKLQTLNDGSFVVVDE